MTERSGPAARRTDALSAFGELTAGELVPDGLARTLDAVDGVADRLLNISLCVLRLALSFLVLVARDLTLEFLRLTSELIVTS